MSTQSASRAHVTVNQQPVIELLFDRLASADGVPTNVAELVLGAVSGDDDLAAALSGQPTRLDPASDDGAPPTDAIYLSSVTVAGFRGVGPSRTLTLQPKPGLTIVVGRNGSGKSSFAEAIELSLTGDSVRWADRHSVWRTGWRNLHVSEPCEIATELRVDGSTNPFRIHRSWSVGAEFASAVTVISGPLGTVADLQEIGLGHALKLYRPFLTAADLSKLLTGAPSELFDAIDAILGLDALTAADRRLAKAARTLDASVKETRAGCATLVSRLAGIDDDRARRAAAVLASPTPDLGALAAILDEPINSGPDDVVAACKRLRDIVLTDVVEVEQLVSGLRTAASAVQPQHDAGVRIAELLRLALDHHEHAGDGPCPMCGVGVLDSGWRAAAESELEHLRANLIAAEQLNRVIRRVKTVIASVTEPAIDAVVLAQLPDVEVRILADAITQLRGIDGLQPDALADHLARTYPSVVQAANIVRSQATAWLERRDSAWRSIATDLRLWAAGAANLREHEDAWRRVKAARTWLRGSGEALRDERLAPFAEQSQRIWQQLRQESNVQLGRMSLVSANTRRRIEFPVSVDGADNGTALGVMSQGELHALGLATFLPRSCADESPFRFVVIDDPVQSMDPAKIDGLARVLDEVASDRQVVVFTHDNRLPEAIRHLELAAEIIEVVRAENSVVTLRPALDPVIRYLDDAHALSCSAQLSEEVRAPIVAELCRSALEAACQRITWRRRLADGHRHADIEQAVAATTKSVTKVLALALFDDPDRGSDVLPNLNKHFGRWAADAYQACRKGVHGHALRDPRQTVQDTRKLVEALK